MENEDYASGIIERHVPVIMSVHDKSYWLRHYAGLALQAIISKAPFEITEDDNDQDFKYRASGAVRYARALIEEIENYR